MKKVGQTIQRPRAKEGATEEGVVSHQAPSQPVSVPGYPWSRAAPVTLPLAVVSSSALRSTFFQKTTALGSPKEAMLGRPGANEELRTQISYLRARRHDKTHHTQGPPSLLKEGGALPLWVKHRAQALRGQAWDLGCYREDSSWL
jgi:hypothetical protein